METSFFWRRFLTLVAKIEEKKRVEYWIIDGIQERRKREDAEAMGCGGKRDS